jgi:D-beta-D-heptose 7-phosphate kinase / D-beta-D-heptose 1-phosphate adenosyltransferase
MYNFDQFVSTTVLCIGDVMLDEFIYGAVARISPEAPTPVIEVQHQDTMVGGAGNVARNLAALGAGCIFIGVIGTDEAARLLMQALAREARIETYLVTDRSRPTTRKVRFVSAHHSTHLLRADWEQARPLDAELQTTVIEQVLTALPRVGAVVLSDYAKGVLTPHVLRTIIDAAREHNRPIIVDPKGRDYAIYRGATLLVPNRKELTDATCLPAASLSEVATAAAEVIRVVEGEAVLVTLSEDGMLLCERGREPVHVTSYPIKVRDVSGAGDTVVASIAAMLAIGADLETAMRIANACAAVVVGKRGVATVSVAELRSRILPAASRKIVYDWTVLDERVAEWRQQGFRVGFTNGCFDILHPGHVKLLTEARAACDRLIVGLNSNASVARLKGDSRPLQDQQSRAEVLAALEAVDLVVLFEDDTPLDLIMRVRPKVLVKGADYQREQVVGHELVEAVILVDLVPGHSTSDIINPSLTNKDSTR